MPYAPGTWGTLSAALFVAFLKPDLQSLALLILTTTAAGAVSSQYAEVYLKEKDSRSIVIDEFNGYLISVFMVPLTASCMTAAFLLFRFYDILKPPPIRTIENKLPGGAGVMADDIMAGIYANLTIQIWLHIP